jgi:hypothetical protein
MGRLLAVVRPVLVAALAVVLVVVARAGAPAHAGDTGSLTGTVFFDTDSDGVRDLTEGPLDGDEQSQVGVCADHVSLPAPEGHRCTWADGTWTLTGLAAGSWTVTVRVGSYQGWTQTAGGHVVQVGAGSSTPVPELGTVAPVGSVAGVVWNDHDGDGVREAGEPGIAGARVFVNDGSEGGFSHTSDAAGRYRVPYVVAGRDVLVRIDDLPGDLPPTAPPGASTRLRVGFAATTTQDFGFDGEAPPAVPTASPTPEPTPEPTVSVPTTSTQPVTTVPGNPRRVRARAVSDGVRVRWLPPSRTGGSPVAGYEVRVARHRRAAGRTIGADGRRLVVTGLEAGHRYWFRVRAVNAVGHGDWSARRAVRPGT